MCVNKTLFMHNVVLPAYGGCLECIGVNDCNGATPPPNDRTRDHLGTDHIIIESFFGAAIQRTSTGLGRAYECRGRGRAGTRGASQGQRGARAGAAGGGRADGVG